MAAAGLRLAALRTSMLGSSGSGGRFQAPSFSQQKGLLMNREQKLSTARKQKMKYRAISVLSVAVFILIWYVATAVLELVPSYSLPSPVKVFSTFIAKLSSKAPDGATLGQHFLASLQVATYGYVLGAVIGVPLGIAMGWFDWVDKLFVYCIVSTVIGARLGHCLFYEWDYYSAHPVEIFKIWKGGLASHGGVFAIILALMWYSKKVTRKSVWWLFDRMIPAVAIVCFCIRLGNLMNSEIFGYPTTLPWGFEFVRSREWNQLYEGLPCHPTQIYEMLYCLVAGVTAWVMYHTYHLQKRVGLITGVSLLIFFGTRFALEFMKNPQVAEEADMTFNIGQWLSVPLILLGAYLIATSRTRKE